MWGLVEWLKKCCLLNMILIRGNSNGLRNDLCNISANFLNSICGQLILRKSRFCREICCQILKLGRRGRLGGLLRVIKNRKHWKRIRCWFLRSTYKSTLLKDVPGWWLLTLRGRKNSLRNNPRHGPGNTWLHKRSGAGGFVKCWKFWIEDHLHEK